MAHLIDKDALIAEIKRRIKYDEMVMNHDSQITELLSRELNTLYELLSFINTLEVKEVDLEKSISDWLFEGLPNEDELIDYIKETAKHFFELGIKAKDK